MTTEQPDSDAPAARFSWRRVLASAIGGTLVAFSLPPWGLWPLAFIGVVVFEAAQGANPTRRQAALRGFAFGLPWMAIGMPWAATSHVSPPSSVRHAPPHEMPTTT